MAIHVAASRLEFVIGDRQPPVLQGYEREQAGARRGALREPPRAHTAATRRPTGSARGMVAPALAHMAVHSGGVNAAGPRHFRAGAASAPPGPASTRARSRSLSWKEWRRAIKALVALVERRRAGGYMSGRARREWNDDMFPLAREMGFMCVHFASEYVGAAYVAALEDARDAEAGADAHLERRHRRKVFGHLQCKVLRRKVLGHLQCPRAQCPRHAPTVRKGARCARCAGAKARRGEAWRGTA